MSRRDFFRKKNLSRKSDTPDTPKSEMPKKGFEGEFSQKNYENLPLVVIVGRPNVGKSTLFNRLMKKRLSIVDPTPGVTRDAIEGIAILAEKPVRLMDTGGFKLETNAKSIQDQKAQSFFDKAVMQKTLCAVKSAEKILLLLESEKITGEDEELIRVLRPFQNKMLVAVNKCEGGRNQESAWNFVKFGFKDPIFISAEHGDNIPTLESQIILNLDFSKVCEKNSSHIKIAILGKPNVGKSTLANRLTNSESSIVSDFAGTTRDVVEGFFSFGGKKFCVLDTAGIRKKSKVQENVEYYSVNRAIKTLDECDVVFLLIDANEGFSEQDKKICALAHDRGRAIIFVLNKWDTQNSSQDFLKKTQQNIKISFGQMSYAPILAISAQNGTGISALMKTAISLYKMLTRKIDTASLNSALKDWISHYPPPATKSMHFKIRYMTQISVNPVKFLIFATSPQNVPESYVSFLKNRIRADLGFEKIPVDIEFRGSRKKWENRFGE